jgi:hypothetical protein
MTVKFKMKNILSNKVGANKMVGKLKTLYTFTISSRIPKGIPTESQQLHGGKTMRTQRSK